VTSPRLNAKERTTSTTSQPNSGERTCPACWRERPRDRELCYTNVRPRADHTQSIDSCAPASRFAHLCPPRRALAHRNAPHRLSLFGLDAIQATQTNTKFWRVGCLKRFRSLTAVSASSSVLLQRFSALTIVFGRFPSPSPLLRGFSGHVAPFNASTPRSGIPRY
jgi:hypothetical protein